MLFRALFFLLIGSLLAGCLTPPMPPREQELRAAIRIAPHHEEGHARYANWLRQRGRWSETHAVLDSGRSRIGQTPLLDRLKGNLLVVLDEQEEVERFYETALADNPENARLWLDRAQSRRQRGDRKGALADAQTSLDYDPEFVDAHHFQGMTLLQTSQQEAALAAFIKTVELDPSHEAAWRQIAQIWRDRGELRKAASAYKNSVELVPESENLLRDYAGVLEQLDLQSDPEQRNELRLILAQIERLYPDSSWIHAHQGSRLLAEGDWLSAEQRLRKSVSLQKDYAWAWFKLAELLLARERHSEALDALQSGLQHQPRSPWALGQTAFVLERLGRIDEAIATYEKLRTTQQTLPLAYRKLSRLYWSQVRMDRAQAVLEAGIQQHPQHGELRVELARLLDHVHDFGEARNVLTQLPNAEGNAQLQGQLARLSLISDGSDRALTHLNLALELDPNLHWARIQRIRQFVSRHKDADAEQELQELLTRNPEDEWGYAELSRLLLDQNRLEEAASVLKPGLEQLPESRPLRVLQGVLLEKQNQREAALQEFEALAHEYPEDALVLMHLGSNQGIAGQFEQARSSILKALQRTGVDLGIWLQFTTLQPETEAQAWYGTDWNALQPVLLQLVRGELDLAWKAIQQLRIDPVQRDALRVLYFHRKERSALAPELPTPLDSPELPLWVRHLRGHLHEWIGESSAAQLHYHSVLNALPENHPARPWLELRIGVSHHRLKQFARARPHFQRFLADFPEHFNTRMLIVLGHTLAFETAAAIPLYEKLILERPNHALALNNLAWSYLTIRDRTQRNPQRALELALQAVELQPSIDHLDTLAEAHFQSGQREAAQDAFRRGVLEADFPRSRIPYLRAQYLRFQSGEFSSDPPDLLED